MGVRAHTDTLSPFQTHPDGYRHWRMEIDGSVARLVLAVDPSAPWEPGYDLKLNSYDLAVDVELHDAVQRLRFEHPEVGAVVITGGLDKVFCAGANIGMLARASHAAKVNFCRFTNETRLAIEDAAASSGQTYICALNGTASGGGYELALACEPIVLVDDGSSAVSFPELPLLAVLPGTGGLTRLVDKRRVRRDVADAFATKAEGVAGKQALAWGLVDRLAPRSGLDDAVADEIARALDRHPAPSMPGVELTPLRREVDGDGVRYDHVSASFDREVGTATITIAGPVVTGLVRDASWWPLAAARELDDLILHLRFAEPALGTIVVRTRGDLDAMVAADGTSVRHDDPLVRETVGLWRRTLKRLENSARSVIALVDGESCFAGALLELVLAADRSFMLDAADGPSVVVTSMNDGPLRAANGLSRMVGRHLDVTDLIGRRLDAREALAAGLVTFAPDDLDWDDEVRLAIEERASFSPDALSGMEANLRFAGPETLETKIFGRLSAWQNWVFLRPNASAALGNYGTGVRPTFDRGRT